MCFQGFPGRKILRLGLSKTSWGPAKNVHVRPPGLAKICEEAKINKSLRFMSAIFHPKFSELTFDFATSFQ